MASYRNISMDFWQDSKVVDDFTPEDRYIYLYCMTNPHTNLCGCYEVSIKQIANETGYNNDSVERLLKRLDNAHNVIRYSAQTKELLILNWCRYNWSTSEKLNKPLLGEIRKVKNDRFREYLAARYNERTTVTAQYNPAEDERPDVTRHKYGAYGWVRLSAEEYERLLDDLGEAELTRCITYVDESAQSNGNKNKWKDWNLVIRKRDSSARVRAPARSVTCRPSMGCSVRTSYDPKRDDRDILGDASGVAQRRNVQGRRSEARAHHRTLDCLPPRCGLLAGPASGDKAVQGMQISAEHRRVSGKGRKGTVRGQRINRHGLEPSSAGYAVRQDSGGSGAGVAGRLGCQPRHRSYWRTVPLGNCRNTYARRWNG